MSVLRDRASKDETGIAHRHQMDRGVSRRQVLGSAGLIAGISLLVACSGGERRQKPLQRNRPPFKWRTPRRG